MTINDIENSLLNTLGLLKAQYGATTTLNAHDNTAATDDLASVLETLNPNHDYPPTNK